MFELDAFVKESNDIEGIYGFTNKDLEAHERFLNLDKIAVSDLEIFVAAVQPGAAIRDKPGMDVRVGSHIPMAGGLNVVKGIEALLLGVNRISPPQTSYCAYEYIHPFTDGNGRSGRVLWLWLMAQQGKLRSETTFLKEFHYQSLEIATMMFDSVKPGDKLHGA